MGRRLIYTLMAMLLALVACDKEKDVPVETPDENQGEEHNPQGQEVVPGEDGMVTMSFSAALEDPATIKTTIDESGKVEWVAGDNVKVIWSDSGSATMTALTGGVTTSFSDVSVGVADYYYAVYPSADYSLNTASSSLSVTIPQSQDGSFQSANYIVGRTLAGGTNLKFYYASSVVKFNISRSDITSVTLRSADGSAIAGSVSADFSAVSSVEDVPTFSVTDGSDEITVPVSGAGTYYAAILPGKAIAGGLLFRASTDSDYLPAAATGQNQASVRGKIKDYTVSGGMDSKIVTDWYVSATGAGSKSGKSLANAFDEASFRSFLASRSSDSAASRSQAFRLYGSTIHVNGTVSVAELIPVSFASGAYEKPVEFTVDGGTLSGGGASSILSIGSGAYVHLSGLTLSGGNAGSEMGGALRIVAATASVDASNCTFSGSEALEGGAVYISSGTLTATDCTFSGNNATVAYNYHGGGAMKLGGASAVAELHRCTFTSNSTDGGGGAVCTSAGAIHATKCTFDGNSAGKYGGALNAEGGNAVIFLSKCKLSGNTSGGWGMTTAIGDDATFAANGSIFYGNSCSGSNDAGFFMKGNTLLTGNTIIEDVSNKAVLHLAGTASTILANNIIIGKDEADMAVYMDVTTHTATSYGGNFVGRIAGASLQACQAFNKNISDIYNWKYKEFSGATWNAETLVFSWTNASVYGFYPAKQAAVTTALSIFGGGFSSWATDIDAYAFTKDISGHLRTQTGLRPGAWEGNNNAMSSSSKKISLNHLLAYYQWGTSSTGVLVMAHRCHINSQDQTENSVSAGRQALAAGADILEIDPRPTKDGHYILCHDKKIENFVNNSFLFGCDKVSDMTLSKIQSYQLVNRKWFGETMRYNHGTGEKIPTLEEFFAGMPSARSYYVCLDLNKIIDENDDYLNRIHEVVDIVNAAGMLEHAMFSVGKYNAENGEDKLTSLRNSFASWGYPDACIYSYPYGSSAESSANYKWAVSFPQSIYPVQATYSPGSSPHNLIYTVRDGMIGSVNMLHTLNSAIPEYSLDASQLDELLAGFPYCHIIHTDTPSELVSALTAKGLRVSRYEDELDVNTGFDGYNPDDYNW